MWFVEIVWILIQTNQMQKGIFEKVWEILYGQITKWYKENIILKLIICENGIVVT